MKKKKNFKLLILTDGGGASFENFVSSHHNVAPKQYNHIFNTIVFL
jgi:hypothetical protein